MLSVWITSLLVWQAASMPTTLSDSDTSDQPSWYTMIRPRQDPTSGGGSSSGSEHLLTLITPESVLTAHQLAGPGSDVPGTDLAYGIVAASVVTISDQTLNYGCGIQPTELFGNLTSMCPPGASGCTVDTVEVDLPYIINNPGPSSLTLTIEESQYAGYNVTAMIASIVATAAAVQKSYTVDVGWDQRYTPDSNPLEPFVCDYFVAPAYINYGGVVTNQDGNVQGVGPFIKATVTAQYEQDGLCAALGLVDGVASTVGSTAGLADPIIGGITAAVGGVLGTWSLMCSL